MQKADSIKKFRVLHENLTRKYRWSVDHLEDLEYVSKIWECLETNNPSGPHLFKDILNCVKTTSNNVAKNVINEGYYTSIYQDSVSDFARPLT